MALRFINILIVIILLTNTRNLLAIEDASLTKEDKLIIKKSKEYFSKGQYQKTISLLKGEYNLNRAGTPYEVIEIIANSYDNSGEYSKAQNLYSYLIKVRYKKKNLTIIKLYKKDGNADDLPEAPDKLYYYYHRRGDLLSKIYVRDKTKLSVKKKNSYKKFTKIYTEILLNSAYEGEDVEKITERIEKSDLDAELKIFNWKWFTSLHYITWRDKLKLQTPTNVAVDIRTTVEGFCLGGGLEYQNAWWSWNVNGCYAFTKASVGSDGQLVNYFQKDVSTTAIFLGVGAHYKPMAKDVSIGFNIPIVYKDGDYTVPSTFTLDDQDIVTFGYLFEINWYWKPALSYSLKFGKIYKFSSSLLSVGAVYHF
jgi:hypothetical protein